MKEAAVSKGLFQDLDQVEFDQGAETVEELAAQTCMGEKWLRNQINKMLSAGKWEKVKKRVRNRVVDAYRRIKHP